MVRPPYLQLPTDHYFDHVLLASALKSYRSTRDKISYMLERGEIVRIRKGLYIRSRDYGGTVEPVEIANAVYGPSYVSLEFALSWYGLIPEGVVSITCVTARHSREFSTPVGRFAYVHIPARAYPVGITTMPQARVGVLMATREKALCDKLACTGDLRSLKEIEEFIVEDQRIDTDEIKGLSLDLLSEIEKAYGLRRISLFVRWYRKNFAGSTP